MKKRIVEKTVKDKNTFLKLLLWVFAIYHIVLGVAAMFLSGLAEEVASIVFNFNLTLDTQTLWLLQPLSAYVLGFGLLMLIVLKDIKKYKPIIYIAVIFIAIRVVQRIAFLISGGEFIFSADPIRNVISTSLLAIYGLLVFFLTRKVK